MPTYDFTLSISVVGDDVDDAWLTLTENPEFFEVFEKIPLTDLLDTGQVSYDKIFDD